MQSLGSVPNSVMVIVKGIAEIFTTFGDSDFKIEYLREGDILNHTLFLYRQPALIPIRCITNVEVLHLSLETVNRLRVQKAESSLNKELDKIMSNA